MEKIEIEFEISEEMLIFANRYAILKKITLSEAIIELLNIGIQAGAKEVNNNTIFKAALQQKEILEKISKLNKEEQIPSIFKAQKPNVNFCKAQMRVNNNEGMSK